ncbi:MAG: GGDEF domain-containing protein [Arenimonas sp.]
MAKPGNRRDSYTLLRDTLRWQVAMVLAAVVMTLTLALSLLNSRLGFGDTALLAWIICGLSGACLLALLKLPRALGATIFFGMISLSLVGAMVFGQFHGRPMQAWAYVLPPVLIFLLRPGIALAAMVAFGAYVCWYIAALVPAIDVVRFGSAYGVLVCFMYAYARLEERAAQMLRYHSDHDPLSNCFNRRIFNETLQRLAAGDAPGGRCAFLLADIDHFKAINDNHGHLVGDRIITQVAATLVRELDSGTPLYRYGGEEFAVVVPGADEAMAVVLAERLRAAVATGDFQGPMVTISIGVSEWRPGRGTVESVLGHADRALYAAKRAGRNRVVAETRIGEAATRALAAV